MRSNAKRLITPHYMIGTRYDQELYVINESLIVDRDPNLSEKRKHRNITFQFRSNFYKSTSKVFHLFLTIEILLDAKYLRCIAYKLTMLLSSLIKVLNINCTFHFQFIFLKKL